MTFSGFSLHCLNSLPSQFSEFLIGVCTWPSVKALSLNDHLRAGGLGPNLNWGKTRSVTLERLDSPIDGGATSTVADTQSGKVKFLTRFQPFLTLN